MRQVLSVILVLLLPLGVSVAEGNARFAERLVMSGLGELRPNTAAEAYLRQIGWKAQSVDRETGARRSLQSGIAVILGTERLSWVGFVEASAWRGRRVDGTGLCLLGVRYYDPTTGRFISPNPLGLLADPALYSFAGGDPVNYFDSDGRFIKGAEATFRGSISGDNPNSAAFALGGLVAAIARGGGEGLYYETKGVIFDPFIQAGTLGAQYGWDSYRDGLNPLQAGIAGLLFGIGEATGSNDALSLWRGAYYAEWADGTIQSHELTSHSQWLLTGLGGNAQLALMLLTPGRPAQDVLDYPLRLFGEVTERTVVRYGEGAHTVFRVDKSTGRVIHYETKIPQTNPRNPNPWQVEKRFDGQGPAHFDKATQTDIPTPHVHDSVAPGGVGPPVLGELPTGYQ